MQQKNSDSIWGGGGGVHNNKHLTICVYVL